MFRSLASRRQFHVPSIACSIFAYALLFASCGGGNQSPTAPSTTTPPAPPATVTLTGTVTDLGGAKLAGATVHIDDGQNAGRQTTTDGNGNYRFDALMASNGNVTASADGYDHATTGTYINGTNTINFKLRTTVPWSQKGVGNTVFDMPTYITRVHVIGDYGGYSSNFVIYVGGRLIVNELVGVAWKQTHHEGTYLVPGGVVQITDSSGVSWSMVEER
jgi:Carboxypeptidase regulatory-like domain